MTDFKLFREEVWLANYSWICPILTTLCFIFLAWDVDLEEKVMVMRVVLRSHETYLQVGSLKRLLCELWNVCSSLGAVWGWIFMKCSTLKNNAPTGLYIINLKNQGNVHLFIFLHILVVITTENMTYDSTLYLNLLHLISKNESQTLRSWVLPDWCYFV